MAALERAHTRAEGGQVQADVSCLQRLISILGGFWVEKLAAHEIVNHVGSMNVSSSE